VAKAKGTDAKRAAETPSTRATSSRNPGRLQSESADHPLRPIREIANAALAALSGDFAALYCGMGRPSVPLEKLLRAMLLQAFYSVRSERQLMERIEFDLLFRWFVGIGMDDPVWDHSTFTKNSRRAMTAGAAAGAIHRPISMARNDPTRRTAARPTPMRGSIARGRAWRRGSASSAMG
jgi:Transposase domain (DUF772)